MQTSPEINEVAKALCAAQKEMKPAVKDSVNPHFKSKFSDFASIWDAIRIPVTSNGLTILQDVTTGEKTVSVTTRIIHTSGQWLEFGPLTIPLAKFDAHGIGSGTTYAKRYALSAALGVVSSDEDDDGNTAVASPKIKEEPKVEYISKEQLKHINELIGPDVTLLDWFLTKLSTQNIESPEKIPFKWFSDVCKSINNKKKEMNIQS